jgi:hypothetical protein
MSWVIIENLIFILTSTQSKILIISIFTLLLYFIYKKNHFIIVVLIDFLEFIFIHFHLFSVILIAQFLFSFHAGSNLYKNCILELLKISSMAHCFFENH